MPNPARYTALTCWVVFFLLALIFQIETLLIPARQDSAAWLFMGARQSHGDSLDAFLIAAIEEVEQLQQAAIPADRIEAELTAIWRRTYAFAAAQEEARLVATWLARGRAIMAHYPDVAQRRRIYKTSLTCDEHHPTIFREAGRDIDV